MKYRKIVEVNLPSEYGEFKLLAYQNGNPDLHHLALVKGVVRDQKRVPVRIHSSCITGDILGSLRCDCGPQLERSLKYISKREFGVVIYLFQEGRGIGLINKLKAYKLQEQGLDTLEANRALNLPDDARTYEAASDILCDLKVKSVALMTNNPTKVNELKRLGINIEIVLPVRVKPSKYNIHYLLTKRERMGHLLGSHLELNAT